MRAIVKTGAAARDLELKDWPEPSPALGEVKLKIALAGICGTDLHIIRGEWPCSLPVVLGHEFCGTIAEVGTGVRHFKRGDRVVASNPARTCGQCRHCRAGNAFMCAERVSAGYMIDGAFAEYMCISEERCHHLPQSVSFRQAALGEPLSVAVHAVIERTSVHAGDFVLVSGPGSVGLLTMMIARLEGARVIVTGIARDRRRLALAKELGADFAVDASVDDLLAAVAELSHGEGVDAAFECAGAGASLAVGLAAVRKGGTLAQVGIFPSHIDVDFNRVVTKELTVIGSYGYLWTSWQRSIQLLSEGKVNTEPLITHELPLGAFEEAFRTSQDGTGVKVIFNLEG